MKACVQTIVLGLLLCLFRGSSCDYRNNEIDSNAREIRKLDRRLDILTNEVRKLKKDSGNGEDEFSELPLPVTPLSARREETVEGVVYTVRYVRQRGVRESIMWENDDGPDGFSREIMSNSIPAYNRGYQETKYLTRNGTNSYVTLYIYTETYWLVVTLLNNGQGNQTSRIEAPKMKIEPASRDLPYTVGENATFTVTTPIEEDADRRGPPGSMSSGRSHVESRLVDLNTRALVHHDVSRQMYDIVEERRYLDQVEAVYSVDTAQHNVSGILIVFASGTHVDELIADVTEGHTLTLHPTSQSGPFPPGFLSFDEPDGVVDPADENGDVVTFCSYDNPTCRIHCSVWGSDISRIELRKIHPSGRATPLDYWSYSLRQTRFKFFKRVDAYVPSSRGVSQRYQCVAWGSLGQSITRNYTLEPFLKARIVEGESSLVRDGDRMANLTCTVTGDPISNITFNLSYNFKYLQNQLPDQVYDHNGTTVAVKQIVYDDGDEYGSTAESTGVLYDAACSVTQNVLGREEFPNTETYYYPSS